MGWSERMTRALKKMLRREQVCPGQHKLPQDKPLIIRIHAALAYLEYRRYGRRG